MWFSVSKLHILINEKNCHILKKIKFELPRSLTHYTLLTRVSLINKKNRVRANLIF